MTPQGIYSMKIFVSLLSRNFQDFELEFHSIFIDFESIYYQFSVIFSQFLVRGSTYFSQEFESEIADFLMNLA